MPSRPERSLACLGSVRGCWSPPPPLLALLAALSWGASLVPVAAGLSVVRSRSELDASLLPSARGEDARITVRVGHVGAPDGPRRHAVEHIHLLNRTLFWWLMGAMVFLVGIGVVRMEATERAAAAAAATAAQGASKDEEEKGAGLGPPRLDARIHAEREQDGGFASLPQTLHLAYCVVALNAAMLVWGIAQEFVTTNYYGPPGDKKQIPSTLFAVFCNRMFTAGCSAVLVRLSGRELLFKGWGSTALPAISNLCASWSQYSSLMYISYTLATVVKSGKLLPVVVFSSLRGKLYTAQDYAEVLVITFSLIVFGVETDGQENSVHGTFYGVMMLGGLLLFDSLTPHLQDRAFQSQPHLDAMQLTFGMAVSAACVSFCVLLVNGELVASIAFLVENPEAILHMVVLSLSSALTQFLISHTIRHFGPVVFTLIATTRQAISVCLSAIFFQHHITALAQVAALITFFTVVVRALRPLPIFAVKDDRLIGNEECSPSVYSASAPSTPRSSHSQHTAGAEAALPSRSSLRRSSSLLRLVGQTSRSGRLAICAASIHIIFCVYAMTQEFLTAHAFETHIFTFPVFLIAVNRLAGTAFGLIVLKLQGLRVFDSRLKMTALPAVTNFLAEVPQYQALYMVLFPVQTLMKSLKVIPVMLIGRIFRNRAYSALDYIEGVIVSLLVFFFTWDFQKNQHNFRPDGGAPSSTTGRIALGVLMMLIYTVMDALTSNFEDMVYQKTKIDPSQQMFGMEVVSGILAGFVAILTGEASRALEFLSAHHEAWQYVALLACASAVGTYACALTVRLFGPAILTLLMVSRQIISLILSMALFQHEADWMSSLCLAAVAMLVLSASIRRVNSSSPIEK